MSTDWKPRVGDLGVVTRRSGSEYPAVYRLATGIDYFWDPLTDEDRGTMLRDPDVSARPLVVIDPDDAEQVKRLCYLLPWSYHTDDLPTVAAALREFASPIPPKPEEPTGLGAVVEDSKGRRFTRTCDCDNGASKDWRAARQAEGTSNHHWCDIDAVRVLSEGVTP